MYAHSTESREAVTAWLVASGIASSEVMVSGSSGWLSVMVSVQQAGDYSALTTICTSSRSQGSVTLRLCPTKVIGAQYHFCSGSAVTPHN